MSERIEPMPEELASAHAGRMALFIGARDHKEFVHWLKQKLTRTAPTRVGMSRLAQMAAACEMPTTDYARQHSLLGVLRAVARTSDLGPHGAPEGEAFTRRMGMVNQKKAAYLCLHCVAGDLTHWKFSWFRRTHHLLGVDWCPSHKTPLLKVLAKDPWSKLPQDWVQQGAIEPEPVCDGRSGITPFEERITEIACTLLRNIGPIGLDNIRELLVARAYEFKLRTCANGARPLVSDMVWKLAPATWLDRHWPEMNGKSTGSFVNAIDKGMSQWNAGISGFGYTTIFAALWDTQEEANQELCQLANADLPILSRKRMVVEKRSETFWQGGFYSVYVENEGRIKAITEQLGVDVGTIRSRMSQIGLPALNGVGKSANWRAFLRFQSGESLSDACAAECAHLSTVELLIRQSCARVAKAANVVISKQKKAGLALSAKKIRPPKSQLKTQTTVHLEHAVV